MSTPHYSMENITPDLAREYLGYNVHNRSLRERLVAAYAFDMENGDWVDNGETIKFSAEGALLDGQHRLAAIVKADTAVSMLVVSGLKNEAQETVDTGAPRKFADVLKLRGEARNNALASVTRQVCQWESGRRRADAAYAKFTNPQLTQTLERYPDIRHATCVADVTRVHVPMPASILGLGYWLFSRIDVDDCEFFFQRLGDGYALSPGDPVATLRRTLIEQKTAPRQKLTHTTLLAYLIKTWNAYRDGAELRQLKYRPGGANPEKVPEPR